MNDGTFDLAAISYQSKLCTLREALAADPRTRISVDEFIGLCNEYGLTGSRAQAAATDLHRSGTILRFTNVRKNSFRMVFPVVVIVGHLLFIFPVHVTHS